jgi:hypothetical protein
MMNWQDRLRDPNCYISEGQMCEIADYIDLIEKRMGNARSAVCSISLTCRDHTSSHEDKLKDIERISAKLFDEDPGLEEVADLMEEIEKLKARHYAITGRML